MINSGLEMVQIVGFTKIYPGNIRAVRDLNLSIDKGDIFGFIGPNGAGKTTTIKFLSTLLKPTYGTAVINGFSVTSNPEGVKRSIGYMPDFYGVYDGMTASEFLDFFSRAYGIGKEKRVQIIKDLLKMMGLESKTNARVDDLSRGMKQRLALARCLVHDPPVLILDEPASGLDPRARVDMKIILKELKKMGKTIIISSHILSELEDLCSKVMIIEKGSLVISGPVNEISKNLRKKMIIRASFREETGQAEKIIRASEFSENIEVYGRQIKFEFSGTPEQVTLIHKSLTDNNTGLMWFEEEKIDLEEVFLSYTTGEVA
jgi:ABC-2 type transport system ATP-binding protein